MISMLRKLIVSCILLSSSFSAFAVATGPAARCPFNQGNCSIDHQFVQDYGYGGATSTGAVILRQAANIPGAIVQALTTGTPNPECVPSVGTAITTGLARQWNGPGGPATRAELEAIQCAGEAGRNYILRGTNIQDIINTAGNLDEISEELVFLTAVDNIRQFNECQNGLFRNYFDNPVARRELLGNAWTQFNEVRDALRPSITEEYGRRDRRARADYVRTCARESCPTPTAEEIGTMRTSGENNLRIDQLREGINALLSRIPMANRDSMRRQMENLVMANPPATEQQFQATYDAEMRRLDQGIQQSRETIRGITVVDEPGNRLYCVDWGLKQNIYRSGQLETTIQGMQLQDVLGNFQARAANRYGITGDVIAEIALIPTYFVGYGAARLALRAGASSVRAVASGGRALATATRGAMLGLEAADYGVAISTAMNECSSDEFMARVSGRQCDPQAELGQAYEEASIAQCVTSAMLPFASALVGTTVRVVNTPRLQLVNTPPPAASENIVVTAQNRLDMFFSNAQIVEIGRRLERSGINPEVPNFSLTPQQAATIADNDRLYIVTELAGTRFTQREAGQLLEITRDIRRGRNSERVQRDLTAILQRAGLEPDEVTEASRRIIASDALGLIQTPRVGPRRIPADPAPASQVSRQDGSSSAITVSDNAVPSGAARRVDPAPASSVSGAAAVPAPAAQTSRRNGGIEVSAAPSGARAELTNINDAVSAVESAWARTQRYMRLNGIADTPANRARIMEVFDGYLSRVTTPVDLRAARRDGGLRIVDSNALQSRVDSGAIPDYIAQRATVDHHGIFGAGLPEGTNSTTQILDLLEPGSNISPAEFNRRFSNFASDNIGDGFGLARFVAQNSDLLRANPQMRARLRQIAQQEDFGIFGLDSAIRSDDQLAALLRLNDSTLPRVEGTFMDRVNLGFGDRTRAGLEDMQTALRRVLNPQTPADRALTTRLAGEFRTGVDRAGELTAQSRIAISAQGGGELPIFLADMTNVNARSSGPFESWSTIPDFAKRSEASGGQRFDRNFSFTGADDAPTRNVIFANFPGRGFSMFDSPPSGGDSFAAVLGRSEAAAIERRIADNSLSGDALTAANTRLSAIRAGTWRPNNRDGGLFFDSTYMRRAEIEDLIRSPEAQRSLGLNGRTPAAAASAPVPSPQAVRQNASPSAITVSSAADTRRTGGAAQPAPAPAPAPVSQVNGRAPASEVTPAAASAGRSTIRNTIARTLGRNPVYHGTSRNALRGICTAGVLTSGAALVVNPGTIAAQEGRPLGTLDLDVARRYSEATARGGYSGSAPRSEAVILRNFPLTGTEELTTTTQHERERTRRFRGAVPVSQLEVSFDGGRNFARLDCASLASALPGAAGSLATSGTRIDNLQRASEIASRRGETLEETVRRNTSLQDTAAGLAERRRLIAEDFPDLTPAQLDALVNDVHMIGADSIRAGRAYSPAELLAKQRRMRELGISDANADALLRLGYTGSTPNSIVASLDPATVRIAQEGGLGSGSSVASRADALSTQLQNTTDPARRLSIEAEITTARRQQGVAFALEAERSGGLQQIQGAINGFAGAGDINATESMMRAAMNRGVSPLQLRQGIESRITVLQGRRVAGQSNTNIDNEILTLRDSLRRVDPNPTATPRTVASVDTPRPAPAPVPADRPLSNAQLQGRAEATVTQSRTLRIRVDNPNGEGEGLLTQYQQEIRRAATDLESAARSSRNADQFQAAARRYAEAGDVAKSAELLEEAVRARARAGTSFEGAAQNVMDANIRRMDEISREISSNRNGTLFTREAELENLRAVNSALAQRLTGNGRTITAPLNEPPPTSFTVSRTSPEVAAQRAQELAAARRYESASLYHQRAIVRRSLEDPNYTRSLSTSMRGSGNVLESEFRLAMDPTSNVRPQQLITALYMRTDWRTLINPGRARLNTLLTNFQNQNRQVGNVFTGNTVEKRNLEEMIRLTNPNQISGAR